MRGRRKNSKFRTVEFFLRPLNSLRICGGLTEVEALAISDLRPVFLHLHFKFAPVITFAERRVVTQRVLLVQLFEHTGRGLPEMIDIRKSAEGAGDGGDTPRPA